MPMFAHDSLINAVEKSKMMGEAVDTQSRETKNGAILSNQK